MEIASNILPLVRMFSSAWLMRRWDDGSGFAAKKASIRSALARVQKRLMELRIIASISDGDAFAKVVLMRSKFYQIVLYVDNDDDDDNNDDVMLIIVTSTIIMIKIIINYSPHHRSSSIILHLGNISSLALLHRCYQSLLPQDRTGLASSPLRSSEPSPVCGSSALHPLMHPA